MPTSIAPYQDIIAVLDTILRYDTWPATYRCATHEDAVSFRHRANRLRVVLRRMEEREMGLPPGRGTSIYDHLVLSIKDDSDTIVVTKRGKSGQLIIGGEEVEPLSDELLDSPELGDLTFDDGEEEISG